MTKSIAILQSDYIPWRGYFDLMRSVDEFVILDSVQFTKNDWRNRNRIRIGNSPAWLTIPIRTAGRFGQKIAEAEVCDSGWARRHWRTISQQYARAPYFRRYGEEIEAAYGRAAGETRLSSINRLFLDLARGWLRIETPIASSESYPCEPDRVERLIAICRAAGARRYLSGPAARAYLDPRRFEAVGIQVRFHDYSGGSTSLNDCEIPLSIVDRVLQRGAESAWQ